MGMFDDFIDSVGNSIVDEINSWGSGPICRAIDNVTTNIVLPAAQTVMDNPGKTAMVLGTGVLTGGLAYAAAPTIAAAIGSTGVLGAASTGTAINTLSGAALSHASLAALGGGAVATKGGGMVVGTAVVGIAGAATGAGVSGATVAVGK